MAAPAPLHPLWYIRENLEPTDLYPSGLAWRTTTGWHRKGSMAGRYVPQTRYYVISLGGTSFTAHRLLYALLSGKDPGTARVYHLSEDRDNRKGLSLAPTNKPFIVPVESQLVQEDTDTFNDTLA
jgi:hypothetical protein